jgi:hypothetical protein
MWEAEVDAARKQLEAQWQGGDPPIALVKEIGHAVLEKRHDQENLDLSTSQMVQRAKAVESALAPLNVAQAEELAAAGSVAEKQALQRQHAKAVEEARASVQQQLHAKNGPKNLMLAEQQFQEVMGVVAAVAPAHADGIRAEQRQLEEITTGATARRQEMQQRLDALLSMQQNVDSQKEEAVEAEMAELEKQMDAALKEEQDKVAKEVKALERRKVHAIKKVESEHAAIEAKAKNSKEKLALKDKHKAELNQLRDTLDREEKRQVDTLEANLRAQTEKRHQDKKAALERKHANDAAAQQKALQAQIDRLKAEEANAIESQQAQLSEAQSGFEAAQQAKTNDELAKLREAFESRIQNENDPAKQEQIQRAMSENLIQATQPMMKQMEESSRQALAGVNAVPQIVSDSVQSATKPMLDRLERMEQMLKSAGGGGDKAEVYHDAREASWQRGASKTVELATDLSARQNEVHSYTAAALDKLQPTGSKNMREVQVAKNLPSTTMSGNAFSQSYHFDDQTGELFIRAERLDSPGEMLVILAHANAHIKSGVMDNDQDPSFQREFYGGLMALMDAGVAQTEQAKEAAIRAAQDANLTPTQKAAAAQAGNIMKEAEEAALKAEQERQESMANQTDKLERRKTEARKKRAEQVKKNVTAKLTGGAEGQPRITAAQARAQQAMVKKLFEAIDTDGDGMLNSTEIKALCVGSGVELTQEKHDAFMEQFNKNTEGLVPFEEFFKWYSSSLTGIRE